MIYAITQFINFDVDKERERINKCFIDLKRSRQEHILQLFLDGNYKECYQSMATLPYDEENECDETEYVHPFIFDNVRAMMEYPNIRIEPIHESDDPSSETKS